MKQKKIEAIENHSSSRNREDEDEEEEDKEKFKVSCWGFFKEMFSLLSLRNRTNRKLPAGNFRYSPLSYAQNFDEGNNEDDSYGSFSSRYAAPSSSFNVDTKND
ncbi:Hypothetical predicted protein [Olea europaea subsp. europaea]|uniref:Uncharacterized protein n=1 Tax=Olea europaea subsp. europaea TaxID=158383 RepID=A0A8S0SQG0_OLEEU|nr:Hypothetical predicted protein [Olea europaea subsp. europaea]